MKRLRVFGFVMPALALCFTALAAQSGHPAPITIDYPAGESIFPPDMAAPTFIWRDPDRNATTWQIEVTFADESATLRTQSSGERLQVGEIDERCISDTNKLPDSAERHASLGRP